MSAAEEGRGRSERLPRSSSAASTKALSRLGSSKASGGCVLGRPWSGTKVLPTARSQSTRSSAESWPMRSSSTTWSCATSRKSTDSTSSRASCAVAGAGPRPSPMRLGVPQRTSGSPTENDHQQLGAGHDRQAGKCPAEPEGAGVAHDDLGRCGIPPQESEAGTHHARGDRRQVKRITHVVARGRVHELAVLVELPHADQHVSAGHHHAGTGRLTVQAIGEVHAVAGARDHQICSQHEEDEPDHGSVEGKVEP